MAIEFECPACGSALQVGDEAAGQVIRCGGCMSALRVPAADPSPPPAPPSPFESDPPAPPRPPRRPPTGTTPPADDEALPTAHRLDDRSPRSPVPSDPRPRRSRRRRPPPPSGGSALIWLLIIGGVGLFGLFACCGGLWLLFPTPHWRMHESEKGGFKVQFPADVRPNAEETVGLSLEPGEEAEGAALSVNEQYLVVYKDVPGTKERRAANRTDEQEIDEALDHLLSSEPSAGKPRRETMKVGGFPAVEIEFHCDAGWYTVRMILADTRLYSLVVHSLSRPRDANMRKFMDSFEITDAKLVKVARERQAEAARAKERDDKRRTEKEAEPKRHGQEEDKANRPKRGNEDGE
jgi:hypothetical protein